MLSYRFLLLIIIPLPPISTLFPYTTLFRSRIIEFRWQLAFLGLIESKPLPDVVEAPAYRQRRRSENYGVELFEQPLAQSLAHVNGRCRQENSFIPAFVPIHEILLIGFEQKHEFLPQLEAAPRQPRELFRFAGLRGHFGFQALQGRE